MKCFDFFLKAQFCNATVDRYTMVTKCLPNEDTRKWFSDQGIRLYTGYEAQIGVLCTAYDVTEDQALLIQLAFDIAADTQELYEYQELRLTL